MINNSKKEKRKKKDVCKPFPFLLESEISCRRHTMRTEMYPFKIRLSDLLLTKRKKSTMQSLRLMLSSLLRTLAWEPASQIILRDCYREIRDKTRYRGVFAGEKCSWTSKITANHKNRHTELMILVFFYVWKDARVWAYWNFSFDMILSCLGPVFCFFFFPTSWMTLQLHILWLLKWPQQNIKGVQMGIYSWTVNIWAHLRSPRTQSVVGL